MIQSTFRHSFYRPIGPRVPRLAKVFSEAPALPRLVLIHQSAWKGYSPKFA
jgi:hypothetical protein